MLHKIVVLLGVFLLSTPGSVASQESDAPPDKKDDTEAAEPKACEARFQELTAEYDKARRDFFDRYRAAKPEEREALLKERVDPTDYAPRFLELAKEFPKEPVCFKALSWIVRSCHTGKALGAALKILTKDHVKEPEFGPLLSALARSPNFGAQRLLRQVYKKHPDREVKGKACYYSALAIQNRLRSIRYLSDLSEEQLEEYTARFGKRQVARLKKLKPEKLQKRAEALLVEVTEKYADVKGMRRTLGESAETELFEMRFLSIGKVAPEIEGEDLDGKTFKLSDYRGKVVVLDFWGHW